MIESPFNIDFVANIREKLKWTIISLKYLKILDNSDDYEIVFGNGSISHYSTTQALIKDGDFNIAKPGDFFVSAGKFLNKLKQSLNNNPEVIYIKEDYVDKIISIESDNYILLEEQLGSVTPIDKHQLNSKSYNDYFIIRKKLAYNMPRYFKYNYIDFYTPTSVTINQKAKHLNYFAGSSLNHLTSKGFSIEDNLTLRFSIKVIDTTTGISNNQSIRTRLCYSK